MGQRLRIEGCATKEDLANPAEFDSPALPLVVKDCNSTDLTVECYAGLVSFTALSPSSSASTTREAKPSLPRGTRAPSCGTRRTAKLASLANSTLQITKAARPAIVTSWTRSGRSSRMPTSTVPLLLGRWDAFGFFHVTERPALNLRMEKGCIKLSAGYGY